MAGTGCGATGATDPVGARGGADGAAAGGGVAAGAEGCVTGGRVAGVTAGPGGEGSGGGAAHPASAAASTPARSEPRAPRLLQSMLLFRFPAMWLILLEAALALGLFVLIVWWTMFHRPRRKPPEDR
jgi:hypothetical protein